MKKIIFFALSLLLMVSAFALDAEVVAVNGKVEIKTGELWQTAAKGQRIQAGSTVSTGFKSSLTLKIDGSTLVVNPLTRLKLEEIVEKENAVASKVFLDTGSMSADVKPKTTEKVEFQIQTPVATASVRGTAGEINASGMLIGTEGTWTYANNSGTVQSYVPSGNTVIIDDTGSMTSAADVFQNQAELVGNETVEKIAGLVETAANGKAPFATPSTITINW